MAVGVIIILQGLVGLMAPDAFANLVRAIHAPPVIYLAAVVRVAFGVVLVAAALAIGAFIIHATWNKDSVTAAEGEAVGP